MMCALETGPCGGTVAGAPSAYIQAGQTWQFTIQKNLDHYNGNPSNPGVFEVNLSPDGGKTFLFVASFADDASPSGSIYTLDFSTPSFLTGACRACVWHCPRALQNLCRDCMFCACTAS